MTRVLVWWQWGGGVSIEGGAVSLTDCNIHDNEALVRRPPCPAVTAAPAGRWKKFPGNDPCLPPQYGGGVYIESGTVAFTDCEIYSNTADVCPLPAAHLVT